MSEQILIPKTEYIYRVQHRIMEGDCQYDHGPRLVKLPSFYIDKYPASNIQFSRFLTETGYWPADDRNFLKHWVNGIVPAGYHNHPVVWVSREDAKAYASWIGGRLPREEEWQLAAGGTQKYKWPWGDEFNKKLCNGESARTTAVNHFKEGQSPFGCLDMCGNTWEWVDTVVEDQHHLFTFLRGGSHYKAPHTWHTEGGPHPTNSHLKFPLLNEGLNRSETVGFRCVKEIHEND